MNKYFRKIIVDDVEYDWLYRDEYYDSFLTIYKIYYEKNKFLEEFNCMTRKRQFLVQFPIQRFCEDGIYSQNLPITPYIVRKFIQYNTGSGGFIITKNDIRKRKLTKINKISDGI